MPGKKRAPNNRTLTIESEAERDALRRQLIRQPASLDTATLRAGVGHGDYREWLGAGLAGQVDLLFLDPPYNLTKQFNGRQFKQRTVGEYTDWLAGVLGRLLPLLKPTATVYICGDWRTSHSIFEVASHHLIVRNRITWERDKGRGAKTNWKNSSEDIWFCTCSADYTFNVDAVKLRRRVNAPYTDPDGKPKDWVSKASGRFRDTHPSNLWTDITVPFWSMPENTDHPTQKSEKLLAKLILASTNPGDLVLDPFLGSGTSVVTAYKLGRRGIGIEIDEEFALLAQKRLNQATDSDAIQGYARQVFWERNTSPPQPKTRPTGSKSASNAEKP